MSSTDDMDARHGCLLAELAEAGMGAARRLSEALRQADTAQDLALLGEAFHKISRSVRQTIALEFKLRHAPREPASPKPPDSPPAERADWSERSDWRDYERPDWDEPLDAVLDAGDRDAINDAVDASIARIGRSLVRAEQVLGRHQSLGCHAGFGDTKPALATAEGGREPDLLRPRTQTSVAALLSSTSPHRDPGLRRPLSRGDSGGGPSPRPPPWRNSG